MPQPLSATVGNFGNVPHGILRQPSFWNWDLTLARRFPVPALGRDSQVRLQLQLLQHLQYGGVHASGHDGAKQLGRIDISG
jgi:hypothetical protein